MLDPRVASDLGAWAVELGAKAVTQADSRLERWIQAVSQQDLELLEGLGTGMDVWTAAVCKQAGFALAIWARSEPTAVREWFGDYRRVFGDIVFWDIEAEMNYRGAQVAETSRESARVWGQDRQHIAELIAMFDEERVAMERAARSIAAASELRSRGLGITFGPKEDLFTRDDFDWLSANGIDDPFFTFTAPAAAVSDVHGAVERYGGELRALRDRQAAVTLHAEAIVAAVRGRTPEALAACVHTRFMASQKQRQLPLTAVSCCPGAFTSRCAWSNANESTQTDTSTTWL
jgi:hypothetical protein